MQHQKHSRYNYAGIDKKTLKISDQNLFFDEAIPTNSQGKPLSLLIQTLHHQNPKTRKSNIHGIMNFFQIHTNLFPSYCHMILTKMLRYMADPAPIVRNSFHQFISMLISSGHDQTLSSFSDLIHSQLLLGLSNPNKGVQVDTLSLLSLFLKSPNFSFKSFLVPYVVSITQNIHSHLDPKMVDKHFGILSLLFKHSLSDKKPTFLYSQSCSLPSFIAKSASPLKFFCNSKSSHPLFQIVKTIANPIQDIKQYSIAPECVYEDLALALGLDSENSSPQVIHELARLLQLFHGFPDQSRDARLPKSSTKRQTFIFSSIENPSPQVFDSSTISKYLKFKVLL